jgi:putative membrane protein insertion efficiency factor
VSRLVATVLIALLRLYKAALSPLLPAACRFHPSCSVYAMGAIGVHGPLRGSWLSLRRLARCHPFGGAGLDPVPPRDGRSAAELLSRSAPTVAALLAMPPPPHLAAHLPPDLPSPSQ